MNSIPLRLTDRPSSLLQSRHLALQLFNLPFRSSFLPSPTSRFHFWQNHSAALVGSGEVHWRAESGSRAYKQVDHHHHHRCRCSGVGSWYEGVGRWWYAGGRKQRSGGDIKPHTQLEQVVLPPLCLPGNFETCKHCSDSWIVCQDLSCFPGFGPILGENRKQVLTGRYPGDYPHNAGDFQQCTLIITIISVLQRHHPGAVF